METNDEDDRPQKRPLAQAQNLLKVLSLSRLLRWGVYFFLGLWLWQNWHNDLPAKQLMERYAFRDSEFLEMEGMSVHYRRTGKKGDAILLLHDAGSSLHTWAAWTELLSADYQVISVDLPGFGLTGAHPRGSYSGFMYASFLEKFTDSLGLKSFHLAGNGLGAQIAWFYAAEHPGRIRKLLLLDAPGFESKRSDWVNLLARTPIVNGVLLKISPKNFVRLRLEDLYADDKLVTDSLVTRHHDLFLLPGNRKAFIDRAQVTENNPPTDFIEKIACPTLVLWGAEDTYLSPEHAYQFHKKIRGADLKIYENTGHWPQEENARQSASDARAFLRGEF